MKSTVAVTPASSSYGRVPSSNRSGTVSVDGSSLSGCSPLSSGRVGDQHAEVRAEELVRRAGEEVRTEGGDVDRRVRRQVHSVDVDQRAGGVGGGRHGGHVRSGSQQVGGTGDRHQAGALAEQAGDLLRVELTRRPVERGPPNRRAGELGRAHPRADVRVVVQPGHDHLVAGCPGLRERPRDVVRELGHRPAEDHAARVGAEQVGDGGPGLEDRVVGPALGIGDRAAVADAGDQRPGHRVGHHARHL